MPTIPLSSERQALAVAIDRYAAAAERAERVRGARIKSFSLGGPAADAVAEAEKALVSARQAETTAVLADLMGDATPPRQTVAEAERTLTEARTAQVAAEQARDALLVEQETAANQLRAAEGERAMAIGAVVRADPMFAAIFADFRAALQRVADLREIVQLLPGKTALEANEAAFLTQVDGTSRGLAQFKAALSALESDADAKLPSGLGDDEDAAAAA